MTAKTATVLIIGYGNPGRLDDGLGPALAEALEGERLDGVKTEANYQLNVEDAQQLSEYDVVIFADASLDADEPFSFYKIIPQRKLSFTTHSLEPETVLGLAHDLFHANTKGYVLGIRGYVFNEFGQNLSEKAKNNLKAAVGFLKETLREEQFEQ